MKRKRKSTAVPFLRKFSFLLILLSFILVLIFAWWSQATGPVDSANKSLQIFVIPQGQETVEIIEGLKEEGLIKSPLAFKIFLLKENLWGKLQAGDFRLSPSMSARKLAFTLIEGRIDVWLVLPEGLRAEEIAEKTSEVLDRKEELEEVLPNFQKEEGYLFPDTYLVPREAGLRDVITMLKQNFYTKTLSWQEQILESDLSLEEALILASLVEREAKYDEDRVKVAEILIQRLNNDWPLQVDASVQYLSGSQGDWWPKVTQEDLQIDSPYNTYFYRGLPPTPICNPGLKSLESVLKAGETPFWYYLSDKKGKMHYAETLEEHEENVARYLKD